MSHVVAVQGRRMWVFGGWAGDPLEDLWQLELACSNPETPLRRAQRAAEDASFGAGDSSDDEWDTKVKAVEAKRSPSVRREVQSRAPPMVQFLLSQLGADSWARMLSMFALGRGNDEDEDDEDDEDYNEGGDDAADDEGNEEEGDGEGEGEDRT